MIKNYEETLKENRNKIKNFINNFEYEKEDGMADDECSLKEGLRLTKELLKFMNENNI